MRFLLSSAFEMTLPVAIVQFGYLFSELAEGARFRNMYQFILETRS